MNYSKLMEWSQPLSGYAALSGGVNAFGLGGMGAVGRGGFGSSGGIGGVQAPSGQQFVTVTDSNGSEQFITVTDSNGVEQRLTVAK